MRAHVGGGRAHAPPQVMADLLQKTEQVREELRAALPTAQRLGSLQQGVERRREKLTKMATKLAELRTTRTQLLEQRQAAIAAVNADYDKRERDMDTHISQQCAQYKQEQHALLALQDTQRQLVPDKTAEPLVVADTHFSQE
eukprot:2309422-Amphidinium_carterae.1